MHVLNTQLPKLYSIYRMRGENYLVCHADAERIRLQGYSSKHTLSHKPEKFLELVAKGELVLMQESGLPDVFPVWATMSASKVKRFNRKRHYVTRLHEEIGGRLPRPLFDAVIARLASEINDPHIPSYPTVARWRQKYIEYDGAPKSYLGRSAYATKRASRLDQVVECIISDAINQVLLKPECVSENHVYEIIKAKILEFNEIRGGDASVAIPCLNTVRDRISRLDPMFKIKSREGDYAARRANQYGGKIHVEDYIGSRVEMDSNFVDVMVWDDEHKVALRPRLTVVFDVPTRCVLGWSLSLSTISAAKSLAALRQAMAKDDFCEVRAVPHRLVVDNGCEFTNAALENSCDMLGISITFCSPRSPNQKPHVERLFRTFNTTFFHNLPGTTKSNPAHRGDYDSENRTLLRIEQLQKQFNRHVYEVYHLSVHSELKKTPLDRWRELAKDRPPRTLGYDESIHYFLIPKEVTINNGRVRAYNAQWTGPGLPTLQEKLSRSRIKTKVKLLIDPDCIGRAYVIDPTEPLRAQPVQSIEDSQFHSMSLAEWKHLNQRSRNMRAEGSIADPRRLAATRISMMEELDKTIKGNENKGERKRAARRKAKSESNLTSASPSPRPRFLEDSSELGLGNVLNGHPNSGFDRTNQLSQSRQFGDLGESSTSDASPDHFRHDEKPDSVRAQRTEFDYSLDEEIPGLKVNYLKRS